MGAKTKIDWCDSTWNPVTPGLHRLQKPARFPQQICCALVRRDEANALDYHP